MKQSADVSADNLQNIPSRHDCPQLLIGTEFYMLFICTLTVERASIALYPSSTVRNINIMWNPWLFYKNPPRQQTPDASPHISLYMRACMMIHWIAGFLLITLWIQKKKKITQGISVWKLHLPLRRWGLTATQSSIKHKPQQQTGRWEQTPTWKATENIPVQWTLLVPRHTQT